MQVTKPRGAFYIFPDIEELATFPGFRKLEQEYPDSKTSPSTLFSKALLEKYLVAVVPGIAFGCENAFRISYATSMEQIQKGMQRINEFADHLKSEN